MHKRRVSVHCACVLCVGVRRRVHARLVITAGGSAVAAAVAVSVPLLPPSPRRHSRRGVRMRVACI